MIYLDTTALLRLITNHTETPALSAYLHQHTDTTWITCTLTRAELLRATATIHPDATDHAHQILASLDLVALTDRLLDAAIALQPPPPHTTNALHLAAALTAGPRLHHLVTYDDQLAAAATNLGITVTQPGRPS